MAAFVDTLATMGTMRILLSLFIALALFAEATPSKLNDADQLELQRAILARTRAELAVYRLDSEYQELRRKLVGEAEKANQLYAEVVKRLQAKAPAGHQINEAGEFIKDEKPAPAQNK